MNPSPMDPSTDQPASPTVPLAVKCITGLPVELLGMIFDIVDAQTRSDARVAHPLLARGVWHSENRLANECIQKGVTMPPKEFFRKAIRAGVAFNYRLIKNLDIFGVNLAAYCNTTLNDVVQTVLPQLIDQDGNIQTQPCFAIPMRILNSPRDLNSHAHGKISFELDLKKVGFDFRLLKTNLVLFNATLTGIQLDSSADINVNAGLVLKGNYLRFALFEEEKEYGDDIPSWGKKVTIKLGTPTVYTTDGILDVLYLRITLMNNFVITSIDIRASPNYELI